MLGTVKNESIPNIIIVEVGKRVVQSIEWQDAVTSPKASRALLHKTLSPLYEHNLNNQIDYCHFSCEETQLQVTNSRNLLTLTDGR